MNISAKSKTACLLIAIFGAAQPALAADEATMMSACNKYAAKHLHLSTSDILDLEYIGQRTDGTHGVNGTAANGQRFQCTFNSKGSHIVEWWHSAPSECPADVSEADRYMYPACN